MQNYLLDWKVQIGLEFIGLSIVGYLQGRIKEQFPEYFEFIPFKNGHLCNTYFKNNFFCFQIIEVNIPGFKIGTIKDERLIESAYDIFMLNEFPSFEDSYNKLRDTGFQNDLFTYIGKTDGEKVSLNHIIENLFEWANQIVIPKIKEMNVKRVNDAIPAPPNYEVNKLFENTYVIMSDEGAIQGTAFHLKGFGVITCDHCIRNEQNDELLKDLVIFKGKDFGYPKKVEVIKTNKLIDIALLNVDQDFLGEGLDRGNPDQLKKMDHIAIAGFPNYNNGDEGIFCPGLIIGFRTHHSINHLLINSPLISGNSGGPVIDQNNEVIGIAVTGADKMSQAHLTEKHGVIPINAIDYF